LIFFGKTEILSELIEVIIDIFLKLALKLIFVYAKQIKLINTGGK
jgi:hypothetical protein